MMGPLEWGIDHTACPIHLHLQPEKRLRKDKEVKEEVTEEYWAQSPLLSEVQRADVTRFKLCKPTHARGRWVIGGQEADPGLLVSSASLVLSPTRA